MAWNPKRVILHDYGGSPQNREGVFNPYHTLVFPDGSVRYRHQGDPFAAPAPHAAHQNDEAIGLSYAGPVGSQPTPEAMRALQQEYERVKGRFGDLPAAGHGEMWEAYKAHPFAIKRPSIHGRDLVEASWRNRVADLSQVPEAGLQPLSLLPKEAPFAAPDTTPQKRPSATPAPEAPSPKPAQEPVIAAKPPDPAKPTPESPFAKPPAAAAAKDSGFDQFHAGATQAAQRMAQEWMQRRRPKTTLPSLFGEANA